MNPHEMTTAPVAAILRSKKAALTAVLPKGLALDRLQGAIMSACQGNARLVDAIGQNADAAYLAIHKSVSWGLEIGHHAYLIPYKGVVELVPSFLGLAELARRHPAVVTLNWHLIYRQEIESGAFELDLAAETCKHSWNPLLTGGPDDIVGGYLVAQLATGSGTVGKVYHPVGKAVFDARYSEAKAKTPANRWKHSPWESNYPEMCMKTILRDAVNRGKIPQSAELQQILSEPDTPAEREVVVESVVIVPDDTAEMGVAVLDEPSQLEVPKPDYHPHPKLEVPEIPSERIVDTKATRLTEKKKLVNQIREAAEMLGWDAERVIGEAKLRFKNFPDATAVQDLKVADLQLVAPMMERCLPGESKEANAEVDRLKAGHAS